MSNQAVLTRQLTRPSVWAPKARQVDLITGDERRPMAVMPRRLGWWSVPEDLAPGTRYSFSLDHGPALPDPRSLSQPDGVHGPSAIVDPRLFTDREPWRGRDVRGGVGYELHVGTFTSEGTFDSAIAHLDYLLGLGVDYVEIMPVATFAGERGWGYDGVGMYAVHAAYGGVEAFVRFIDAAHARGLGVVLDVVFNHLGPEGNYLSQFGPYFTDRHQTPWGEAVNLDDYHCHEVRDFFLFASRQWLVDFQLDGLRLDAVHALKDEDHPHFLAELAHEVATWRAETGRPMRLIAESDLNQVSMVTPTSAGRHARGMDAQWADDVHHALHSFVSHEQQGYYVDFGTAEVLQKVLTQVFLHDGTYSTFREQDWGAPVDPHSPYYDGHSFVTSLQNHDQVGNRAIGDRISFGNDLGLQAAGAALHLLSPFAPMLFMGEEWAASTPFPFFSDLGPDLGPLVTKGRAREFAKMGWGDETPDPQAVSTFTSAVLNWAELHEDQHADMLDWYRALIRIRHEHGADNPSLASTRVEIVDDDTLIMWRNDQLAVAATRSAGEHEVDFGHEMSPLISWGQMEEAGEGRFKFSGPGAVVVRIKAERSPEVF